MIDKEARSRRGQIKGEETGQEHQRHPHLTHACGELVAGLEQVDVHELPNGADEEHGIFFGRDLASIF